MIIKVILTNPTTTVPVNTQHMLNGFIHKSLGEGNKWHNAFSEYAISSLQGGHLVDGNLVFDKEPYFIISSEDSEFITKVMVGFPKSNAEFYGMRFKNFGVEDYVPNQYFDKVQTISPILLKEKGRIIAVDSPRFIEVLTNNCMKKLEHHGIIDDTFRLEVRYPEKSKVKKIMVGDIFNICSMVSLNVYGTMKARKTLYNLGFGKSTGSGFGSVKILGNN